MRSLEEPSETPESRAEDFRLVRDLLVGSEKRELELLRERCETAESAYEKAQERIRDLENVAEAIDERIVEVEKGDVFVGNHLSAAFEGQFAEGKEADLVAAMAPGVEASFAKNIEANPERYAELLRPVIEKTKSRESRFVAFFKSKRRQKSLNLDLDSDDSETNSSVDRSWVKLALICAAVGIVLGWGIFSFIKGMNWNQAMTALHEEPGIEVLSVEKPIFGKRKILGLRDPLATSPAGVLRDNGINPDRVDIRMTEYLSLNTPYSRHREKEQEAKINEIRNSLVEAVGGLASASESVRNSDREEMNRALFRMNFPEAADQVTMTFEGDRWIFQGNLEEPYLSDVKERAGDILLMGEADLSGLRNSAEVNLEQARAQLEMNDFLFLKGTADFVEETKPFAEVLTAMVAEANSMSLDLRREPFSYEVHVVSESGDESQRDKAIETKRIEAVKKLILKGGVSLDQILPGVHDPVAVEDNGEVYIRVIVPEAEADKSAE